MSVFLSDNHHTLVCSKSALPASSRRMSKECLVKSQELIKVVIVTASSRIFLRETIFSFSFFPIFTVSTWVEEHSDPLIQCDAPSLMCAKAPTVLSSITSALSGQRSTQREK